MVASTSLRALRATLDRPWYQTRNCPSVENGFMIVSMKASLFVHVPRPLDSEPLPEAKTPTIHWRRIVFLFTPILLALANLVEARFEKARGYQVGQNKYLEYKGRGEAAWDAKIRGAGHQGNARNAAIIAKGENEAR